MTTLGSAISDSTRLATPVAIANQGISTGLSFQADPEESRKARELIANAAIERNRAATPPGATEQRAVQRLSIAELNQLDLEQLRRKLSQSRFDDRPPIIRALDLIDLPRNALFNLAAPGLAAKREAEGDTAAFGLPRVSASDVLGELGVENRIVRAIGGFVGDVAFDPLTYLGPAGVGLKVSAGAAGGGRLTLNISKAGRRKLQGAIKAAAKAGTTDVVEDQTIRNLLNVAGSDRLLQRAAGRGIDADRLAGAMQRRILGDVREGVARRLFLEPSTDSGLIARRFFGIADEAGDDIAREIDAVKAFARQFERNVPGLRIGRGGSQVAHIPFTSLNVQVPAFTAAGRASIAAGEIARIAAFSPEMTEAIRNVSGRAERLLEAVQREHAAVNAERLRFTAEADEIKALEETGDLAGADARRIEFERARQERRIDRSLASENIRGLADSIEADSRIIGLEGGAQAALHLAKVKDIALQAADRASVLRRSVISEITEGDVVNRVSRLGDEATENADIAGVAPEAASGDRIAADFTKPAPLDESFEAQVHDEFVSDVQQAVRSSYMLAAEVDDTLLKFTTDGERAAIEVVKTALGTNDDVIGASLMTPVIDAARWALGEDAVAVEWARRVDRAGRRIFGRRSGEAHAQLRYFERGKQQAAMRAYAEAANDLNDALLSIASKHSVPPEQVDDLYSLATALWYQRADPNAQHFYADVWTPNGPVSVDEAIRSSDLPESSQNALLKLLHAERNGVLQNQELRQDLIELVDRLGVGYMEDLKILAQEAGELGISVQAYIPGVLTREASRAIRSTKRVQGRRFGAGAADSTTTQEAFQQSKSTTQYRFQDPDTGQWRRFFEFERAYLEASDAAKQLPDVAETIETMQRFDELVKDGVLDGRGRATDIFELNALVKDGRFSMLTGDAPLDTGFFESSIVSIAGARAMAHERAMARNQFVRFMRAAGPSVWINPARLQAKIENKTGEIVTEFGTTVKVVNSVNGQPGVKIGGTVYRQLDPNVVGENNPIRDALRLLDESDGSTGAQVAAASARAQAYYEESVADVIERAARLYTSENDKNALFTMSDFITSKWKETTLLHPSWMVSEVIGNAVLWLMGDVRPQHVTKHFTKAAKLVWLENHPGRAKDIVFNVGGQRIRGDQLLRNAYATFADSSRGAETAAMSNKWLGIPLPSQDRFRDIPATIKAGLTGKRVEKSGAKGVGEGPNPFGDSMWRRFIGPWFRADAKLNNAMRITAYLSYLEQGFDATTAARRTIETMFDMTDLTRFEQNVARRFLLPFYTWIRNNTAYQMRMLFERPVYAANFPRLRDRMEEAFAGEERVPRWARPSWMREQLALQIGTDPQKRWSVLLRSGVPIGDAFEALAATQGVEGVQDFFQYMIGSGNPVWKAPIEIAAGREIFSRREIGATTEEGDLSVKDFLLSQIRPLRETGIGLERPGPLAREFGRGTAAGLSRLAIGGRAQSFDDERLRSTLVREFTDVERRLRIAIRRAERENQPEVSLKARVRLMSLYERMLEVGLADDVPKWAKEQLSALAAVGGDIPGENVGREPG